MHVQNEGNPLRGAQTAISIDNAILRLYLLYRDISRKHDVFELNIIGRLEKSAESMQSDVRSPAMLFVRSSHIYTQLVYAQNIRQLKQALKRSI